MTYFADYLRTRWEWFWFLVDSDSILVNQLLFYLMISISGVYNLVFSAVPIQAMEESTSAGYYFFWLWLCAAAPLVTIAGKLLKNNLAYTGLWLQLAGDVGTWVIFISYVTATFGTAFWGKGLFAGFLALACLIGTPIFIARDVRKLRQVELRVKRDAC